MAPEELFAAVHLVSSGAVAWGTAVSDEVAGVYVVSLDDPSTAIESDFPEAERDRWLPGRPIIYIGRARNLSRRLSQFYRHKYGAKAPHRGGQAILLLSGAKRVHWATVDDHVDAERRLIDVFVVREGATPVRQSDERRNKFCGRRLGQTRRSSGPCWIASRIFAR